MNKYIGECIGTFVLVFVGTLIITQAHGNVLVIALGFGVTLSFIVYFLGSLSGAHVNPAVSFGAWLSGKFSLHDLVPYWMAQYIGAIAASILVFLIVGPRVTLGETTFSTMSAQNAFLVEMISTFFFVIVILTTNKHKRFQSAVIIGAALVIIHLLDIPLTGASVNPARSIAPVVVGAHIVAASQIWVYIAGPLLGGVIAGLVAKYAKRGMYEKRR